MSFIQIIEIRTTQPEVVERIVDEWRSKTVGRRTTRRATMTEDRDHANTYVNIVEFDSYEDAMTNSALPETASLSEQLAQLSDGPIVFRNLEVRSVQDM